MQTQVPHRINLNDIHSILLRLQLRERVSHLLSQYPLFSGLIGRSWAMLFAAADYRVQIYDIEPKQLTSALEEIKKQLAFLENLGLLRGNLNPKQQYENISTTVDIGECVTGAVYIQVWHLNSVVKTLIAYQNICM